MKNKDLEEIYIAYYREVYLYTLSLSKNVHVAEDLTSEAFYKALLSLDEKKQNIKFWLFTVSRNLYYDKLRKESRVSPGLEEEMIPIQEKGAWEHMVKQEETRELYRAILGLSAHYREPVFMFYFMNYSINEISAFTGKNPGSVKTLLCRARQQLKQSLKEDNHVI